MMMHIDGRSVSNVLPLVTGLRPSDVAPKNKVLIDGRYRRVAFAVERPGLKVAIEIDGRDQAGNDTGMNWEQHQDFLDRQNALVLAGWTPLRFHAVEVRDHPASVARRIDSAIVSILRETPMPSEARDPSSYGDSYQTTRTPEPSPAVPTPVGSGIEFHAHLGDLARPL